MSSREPFRIALLTAILVALAGRCAGAADDAGTQFFRDRIEPVLKRQCYQCHSAEAEELQGGLRLDSRPGTLRGGDSGPAVVSGKSAESLLIQAIRHEGDHEMPPDKPQLADAVIADFVQLGRSRRGRPAHRRTGDFARASPRVTGPFSR